MSPDDLAAEKTLSNLIGAALVALRLGCRMTAIACLEEALAEAKDGARSRERTSFEVAA